MKAALGIDQKSPLQLDMFIYTWGSVLSVTPSVLLSICYVTPQNVATTNNNYNY